eukprot:8739759-Alexandrium_andersonii.AAC.1
MRGVHLPKPGEDVRRRRLGERSGHGGGTGALRRGRLSAASRGRRARPGGSRVTSHRKGCTSAPRG